MTAAKAEGGPATKGSTDGKTDVTLYFDLVSDLSSLEKEAAKKFTAQTRDDEIVRYLETSMPRWEKLRGRFERHSPGTSDVQRINRDVTRLVGQRIGIHRDLINAVKAQDSRRVKSVLEEFKAVQTKMTKAGEELGRLAVKYQIDIRKYDF